MPRLVSAQLPAVPYHLTIGTQTQASHQPPCCSALLCPNKRHHVCPLKSIGMESCTAAFTERSSSIMLVHMTLSLSSTHPRSSVQRSASQVKCWHSTRFPLPACLTGHSHRSHTQATRKSHYSALHDAAPCSHKHGRPWHHMALGASTSSQVKTPPAPWRSAQEIPIHTQQTNKHVLLQYTYTTTAHRSSSSCSPLTNHSYI